MIKNDGDVPPIDGIASQEMEELWLSTRQPDYLLLEEIPEDYELKTLSELQEYPGKGE
jgi:hypothetical protein